VSANSARGASGDARTASTLFDPDRLRLARQLKKLKRSELAELVGVSAAAISQYESGSAKPRPATLAQLALHLKMPVGFFAHSGRPVPPLDTDQGFFRSLRRSTQVDRDAALAHAALLADLVEVVESRVVLPPLDLPDDLAVAPTADLEEVEAVARQLRLRWDLGEGPIPSVVRTLERHGVIVARLALARDVDAFSWPVPARPIVILGSDKGARDRSRFDAAHELGHLVMHYSDPEPASQKLERQANRFAGALLLPRETLAEEFASARINWTRLLELKQRWQVSLSALLFRARDLGVLSPTAYESAMKHMSRRGWRHREPGDLGPPERPALLRRATELLEEHGVDVHQLGSQAHVPFERVEELLGLRQVERPVVAV
jgi:Zn-dependent peptidase ImmA (M78 family)/DNA-binding transcriptional regulator YiaG